MKKIFDTIYRLVDFIVMVTLTIMVGSIFINVIARYFGLAFTWVDEVSRLAFVWMSFMAIVAGLRKKLHPAFDVLLKKAGRNKGWILNLMVNLMVLVFLLYLFKGGVDYISRTYVQKTAILGISVAWKYLAVPVATGLMVIETLRKILSDWTNRHSAQALHCKEAT